MALVKNNAAAMCLVALLVISASLFPCDASRSMNIGTTEAEFGKLCFAFPECVDSYQYTFDDCSKECKKQGYGWDTGYCKNDKVVGGMCCCLKA
ncbi:unnamed protein product [Alopecurus aequalis]